MLAFRGWQSRLENIYKVAVQHSVDDFITSDAELVGQLHQGHDSDEKLLVRQHGDQLDLALYLDAALIDRLALDDPDNHLHDGNWADFCTALEGVSHFLYLTWNAERQRSVRPVELELQAEIDKYIVSVSLFGKQHDGRVPLRLHPHLFERFSLAPGLAPHERQRYRDANRYAGKYCRQLERCYLRGQGYQRNGLSGELRDFYRLPLQQKLRRIDNLAVTG